MDGNVRDTKKFRYPLYFFKRPPCQLTFEENLKIRGIISWLNRLGKKQKNLSYFGEFILHLEEYGEPPF